MLAKSKSRQEAIESAKGDAYSAVGMLIFAALFFIVCWYLIKWQNFLTLFIPIVIALIGMFLLMSSTFKIARLQRKRGTKFDCPFCGNRFELLFDRTQALSTTTYLCSKCKNRLYVKASEAQEGLQVMKINCPYCATEHGVTEDYDDLVCPSCGLSLQLKGGTCTRRSKANINCSHCVNLIPDGVYYCNTCWRVADGQFTEKYKGPADPLDRLFGTTPNQHLLYSELVCKQLLKELAHSQLFNDKLRDSQRLLRGVEEILESLNTAFNPLNAARVATLCRELDKIYAITLSKLYNEISTYRNLVYKRSEVGYQLDCLCQGSDYAGPAYRGFISLRNTLTEKLRTSLANDEHQSFKAWTGPLIHVEFHHPSIGVWPLPGPEMELEFVVYVGLLEEAKKVYPEVTNIHFEKEEA